MLLIILISLFLNHEKWFSGLAFETPSHIWIKNFLYYTNTMLLINQKILFYLFETDIDSQSYTSYWTSEKDFIERKTTLAEKASLIANQEVSLKKPTEENESWNCCEIFSFRIQTASPRHTGPQWGTSSTVSAWGRGGRCCSRTMSS